MNADDYRGSTQCGHPGEVEALKSALTAAEARERALREALWVCKELVKLYASHAGAQIKQAERALGEQI